MATLEKAISIAVKVHKGDTDKAGASYILHPLRVMARCRSEEARIAAVLHDVVEDSQVTLQDLRREGFSTKVVTAVDHLTKRKGEKYPAFIERAARNPIAREVKLADLEDNMDIRRLKSISADSVRRLRKYLRAWRRLAD